MKTKRRSKFSMILATTFVALALVIAAVFATLAFDGQTAHADTAINITPGMYDAYTDKDQYNHKDRENGKVEAKNISEYSAFGYNETAKIEYENPQQAHTPKLKVTGDDVITEIVPKELFMNCGDYTYIGKKYGFYVHTFTDVLYDELGASVEATSTLNKHSIVMVFALGYKSHEEQEGGILVSMKILFQYEYAYLSPNNNLDKVSVAYLSANSDNLSNVDPTNYKYELPYEIANGCNEGVVVPAPYVHSTMSSFYYAQAQVYYIKDLSLGVIISNENELNYGDNGYTPENDKGCFLIGSTYKFSGKAYSDETLSTEAKFLFAVDNVILPLMGYIPGVGDVISIVSDTVSLTSALEPFGPQTCDIKNTDVYTTDLKYTTKQDQILNYTQLYKAGSIQVETARNSSIWFGQADDYVDAKFIVNQTERWYANVARFISFKIVSIANPTGTSYGSVASFNANPETSKQVNVDTVPPKDNVHLLPHGSNKFHFVPTFSGKYRFGNVANCDIMVKENDSIDVSKVDGFYDLLGSHTYNIVITNLTNERKHDRFGIATQTHSLNGIQSCSFNVDNLPNITGDNMYIFKVAGKGGFRISTTNLDYKIMYLLNDCNNDDLNHPTRVDGCNTYDFIVNDDLYVVVKNTGATSQAATITISKIEATSYVMGTISAINIDSSTNNKIIKLSLPVNEVLNMSLSSSDSSFSKFVIYDINGNEIPTTTKSTIGNGAVKYITFSPKTDAFVVVDSTCSYQFKIVSLLAAGDWYINGELASAQGVDGDGKTTLKRGLTDTLHAENSNIKSYLFEYRLANTINNASIIYNTGAIYLGNEKKEPISIYDTCPLNTLITVKVIYDEDELTTSYIDGLLLICIVAHEGLGTVNILSRDTESEGCVVEVGNVKDVTSLICSFIAEDEIVPRVISDIQNKNRHIIITTNERDALSKTFAVTFVSVLGYSVLGANNKELTYSVRNGTKLYNTRFGSLDKPYAITCERQLRNIRLQGSDTNSTYELQNDIALSTPWNKIHVLGGTIDGCGHTITGLDMSIANTSTGAFGFVGTNEGAIKNLTLSGAKVHANEEHSNSLECGILVGKNSGTIDNCKVIGNSEIVVSREYSKIGGVVGQVLSGGIVSNCRVSATVLYGNGDIGGIAGSVDTNGSITSSVVSYSTIQLFVGVNGNDAINRSAGGIAGFCGGTLYGCAIENSTLHSTNIFSDSTTLQPRIGIMVGTINNGSLTNFYGSNTTIDKRQLHAVVTKKDWLGRPKEYFYQDRYVDPNAAKVEFGYGVYGEKIGNCTIIK